MRLFTTGLMAVVALGFTAGVSQAFLVTHSTQGTLFYDDLEEAAGEEMLAETGSWGISNTEMITGAFEGGPDGAALGETYAQRWRGAGAPAEVTLMDAGQEAVFTEAVSTGILHIEFMYWMNPHKQSLGIIDNHIGMGQPPIDGVAYILGHDAHSETMFRDERGEEAGGNTGALINYGQWNKLEIDIDLDTGMNQVTVNGVAGAAYANLAGPGAEVARVHWRSEGAGFGHFIDATVAGVALKADFNDDGVIDDLDLTILATHWQTTGGHGDGDANDDGFIDDLDLTALATEWPTGDLDVSAVPEPAMLSLLVLGAAALIRRKR